MKPSTAVALIGAMLALVTLVGSIGELRLQSHNPGTSFAFAAALLAGAAYLAARGR